MPQMQHAKIKQFFVLLKRFCVVFKKFSRNNPAPSGSYVIQSGHNLLRVPGGDQFHPGFLKVLKALEIAGKVAPHLVHAGNGAFVFQGKGEMAFGKGHAALHRHGRHGLAGIQELPDLR